MILIHFYIFHGLCIVRTN